MHNRPIESCLRRRRGACRPPRIHDFHANRPLKQALPVRGAQRAACWLDPPAPPAEKGPCVQCVSLPLLEKNRRWTESHLTRGLRRVSRVGALGGELPWASRSPSCTQPAQRGVRIRRMTHIEGSLGSVSEDVCEQASGHHRPRCTCACTHTHAHTCAHAGGSGVVPLPPRAWVSHSRFPVSPAGNREQLV